MFRSITLLAAAASFYSASVIAQTESSTRTEETIILKKSDGQPQTTIEIADGEVRVNGETVAKLSGSENKSIRKRIIIDSGDDAPDGDGPDRPSVIRKTVLGVLTETTPTRNGARVKRVLDNSAAEDAELRTGDRIFKVDDRQVKSSEELVSIIGGHQPGDKVVISYERDGKNRTATATLRAADPETTIMPFGGMPNLGNDEMPNGMFRSFPFGNFDFGDMGRDNERPKIGLSVEDRAEGDGVRVIDVTDESAADKAGLKEGDVITHVDGEPLQSVEDLQLRVRAQAAGDKLALRYQRAGKPMKTDVTVPKSLRKRDL